MRIKPSIIIGLGNPGVKYKNTYHNIGSLFLDSLAEKHSTPNLEAKITPNVIDSKKFGYIKVDDFVLVKPPTFMNESGRAVKSALRYFKKRADQILIAHDDSDIELGKYKFSFGRNSAGHRGVESVINSLNTKNFWRLRIGVRSNIKRQRNRERIKAEELVMKPITQRDWGKIQKVFGEIVQELAG